MGSKKKFKITEDDYIKANRAASREEEIEYYGKQIRGRTSIRKSKRVYNRKDLKKFRKYEED